MYVALGFADAPASRTVDTLVSTTVLLAHMLRGLEFYALRQKLTVHPVRRIFNGMYHMLTVTMGRIGFAEVPDVVAPEERFKLDKIRGTSRLSLTHPPLLRF